MPNYNNLRNFILAQAVTPKEADLAGQMYRGPDFTRENYAPPFGKGKVYNTPVEQMSPSYNAPARSTNPYESLKGLTGPLNSDQIDALHAIQRWNEGGANAPNLWDPAFKGYSLVAPPRGSENWTLEKDRPPRERRLNPLIDKWDRSDPVMDKMLDRKGFGVFDNTSDIFTKENIVDAWKRLTNSK